MSSSEREDDTSISRSKKRHQTRSRSRNGKKNSKNYQKLKKVDHKKHKKQETLLNAKRSDSHWKRRNTPHFDWEVGEYIKGYKTTVDDLSISE